MGIIFVNRVVRMDQRHIQLLRNPSGQKECGKLTLRMDHIPVPIPPVPVRSPRQSGTQAGSGIDQPRRHGPQGRDTVLLPGASRLRKC